MKRKARFSRRYLKKKLRSSDSYIPTSRLSSRSTSTTGLTDISSSSRKSSWDYGKEVLLKSVGAGAGYYIGGVGGAVSGYDAASSIINWMDTSSDYVPQNFPLNKTSMSGSFQGNFSKPGKYGNGLYATMASRGYVQRRETFGRINDPHALYVGHSTFDPQMMSGVIVGALVRKLLKQTGIPTNDRFQDYPVNLVTGSSKSLGYKIEFVISNPTDGGIALNDTYTFVDLTSFSDVVAGLATMQDFILSFLVDYTATDYNLPFQLILYSQDTVEVSPAIAGWRMESKLDLTEEIMTISVDSWLTVQNRTAPVNATAGGEGVDNTLNESDRIDAQPLKGRLFQFRNADPRLRINNIPQKLLNMIPTARPFLVRAAELSDSQFEDIVPPNYFQNVEKHSYVKLEPGKMKRCHIKYSRSGLLNSLLVALRATTAETLGTTQYASRVIGKAQIIGFEEEMRTASANEITVAYERQLLCGVYFKTRKPAPLKIGLAVEEYNNL